MPEPVQALEEKVLREIVARALAEDIGSGDVTTAAVVDPRTRALGRFIAREPCVVCGLPLAREVFARLDPGLVWASDARDGDELAPGQVFASVSGASAPILTGERTALNFLQRLSGIATLARRAVREVAGTRARILDTRKTTPTLRALEKYAVRAGGAENHRTGLYDAILIKDNHVALAGGVGEAVRRARERHDPEGIEVEVENLEGVREALEAGARRLLLDNFTPEQVARAVSLTAGRATVEVSGGLRIGALKAFAEAGADFLSIGALTHSASAVDLALELTGLPKE